MLSLFHDHTAESTSNAEKSPKIHHTKFHNFLPVWVEEAAEYISLNGTFRQTLQLIANHCDAPDNTGVLAACLTGEHMREKRGVCRQTLTRHITKLVKLGLVVRLSNGGGWFGSVLAIPGRRGQLDAYAQPEDAKAFFWNDEGGKILRRCLAHDAKVAREALLEADEAERASVEPKPWDRVCEDGASKAAALEAGTSPPVKSLNDPTCCGGSNGGGALPSHTTNKKPQSLHVSPDDVAACENQWLKLDNGHVDRAGGVGRAVDVCRAGDLETDQAREAKGIAEHTRRAKENQKTASVREVLGNILVLSGCNHRQIMRVVTDAVRNGWDAKQMLGVLKCQKIRKKGFGWTRTIWSKEPTRTWGRWADATSGKLR